MAATPAPMSANQTAYLNGLVKAGGGNAEWAKSQLGAVPQSSGSPTPMPQPGSTTKTDSQYVPYISATPSPDGGNTTEYRAPLPTDTGVGVTPPTPKSSPAGDLGETLGKFEAMFNMPVAASNSTPAPVSQGSFPGQLSNAQIQAEAQARIDKQLATAQTAATGALTGAKNAYDYSQKTTQGNRALLQFDNSNRGDQFGGSAREDNFRLSRQQGIEDTAQNNNYNAQVQQINQKLQDIQTAAPGDQQAMIDQLTKQERDYGIQVGQLTGTFNGQSTLAKQGQDAQYTGMYGGHPTLQAQNQNFQQNLATNQDNRATQGQNFNQNMQNQQFAYTQARDAIKDKQYQETFDRDMQKFGLEYALKQATLQNQITNDQAQRAIGYMNAHTSQQNADTTAANGVATRANLTTDNNRQQTEFDQKQKNANYQKSFNNLKSLYTAKDPYTGEIKTTNPQALRAAILAKNLSDDETIQMLSDFGLPIKQ